MMIKKYLFISALASALFAFWCHVTGQNVVLNLLVFWFFAFAAMSIVFFYCLMLNKKDKFHKDISKPSIEELVRLRLESNRLNR